MCSGPRFRTYSNKYTKYTDPKLFVHYWDLFYLVKRTFYCSLEITNISFCFSLKAAAQRWPYSSLSCLYFFSAAQWQSQAGLIAYLTTFIANFLTRVRRGVGEKSPLYALEQISHLKQITSTCSFKIFIPFSSFRMQFHEWFSQFKCGLQVIEKDSSTVYLPQHRHLFCCFTWGWFFFRASYLKPFPQLNYLSN